jgi:hypothetical protein
MKAYRARPFDVRYMSTTALPVASFNCCDMEGARDKSKSKVAFSKQMFEKIDFETIDPAARLRHAYVTVAAPE